MIGASHALRSDKITATILAHGAELSSLKNAEGLELLWQAGPQWPRHSPLLFPIVGRLKNDELHHRGKTYPMTQHGVARDHRFVWLEQEPAFCKLVLYDNPETQSRYPFAFRLEVAYSLKDANLDINLAVTNTGNEPRSAGILRSTGRCCRDWTSRTTRSASPMTRPRRSAVSKGG
jgi:galactose mutarotase-like enzyme